MVKNTLTVGRIEEGICSGSYPGRAKLDIYKYLHLG
mgnify:CR=1 FL=1